jgi:hypothetical protein
MFYSISFAQSRQDSIIVLPLRIAPPDNAKKVGTIRVGNNATKTKCDYEEVIQSAKEKARGMGGNIVKITKLIEPAFISKCYSISADVYHADELPDYHLSSTNGNTLSPANTNYALLYIYRLKDTVALVGSYSVHLDNDSVICTVKSKSRDSVKIYKEGKITLWSKIEKREELKLNVKPGQTYYIRCGLRKGEIRMIPVIELVDDNTGKAEYDQLKKGKKDMDVKYLQQIH